MPNEYYGYGSSEDFSQDPYETLLDEWAEAEASLNFPYKPINDLKKELTQQFESVVGQLRRKGGDPQQAVPLLQELTSRLYAAVATLQRSPDYQNALRAYQKNDQKSLEKLIPKIFDVFPIQPIVMYHGVYPKPGDEMEVERLMSMSSLSNPREYTQKVVRIAEEGLKPAPLMHGYGSDDKISAVYFANHPASSYGPALFYMENPKKSGYATFSPNYVSEETLIYSPRIDRRHIHLGLKSKQFGRNIMGALFSDPRLASYRDEVENHLQRAGARFKLFNP